jgi:hypothetical protein
MTEGTEYLCSRDASLHSRRELHYIINAKREFCQPKARKTVFPMMFSLRNWDEPSSARYFRNPL